jgi:signal peptidase I
MEPQVAPAALYRSNLAGHAKKCKVTHCDQLTAENDQAARRWRLRGTSGDRLKPMMSNEHGMPERATGAQGAGEAADGVSVTGSHGYSALAGGTAQAAGEPFTVTGSAAPDLSASAGGFSAASRTREYEPGTGDATAGPGGPGQPEPPADDPDGSPAADPDQAPAGKTRRMSAWRELPILIVVALTIALVIKTFVVQPFFIPSSSMENTLMIGDKVLVNKLVYHFRSIQPGDIIVFDGDGSWNANPPQTSTSSNFAVRAYDDTLGRLFHSIAGLFGTPVGQTDYIKRVIGTPGDRVKCCNAQGLVTVNGVALHEQSYLFPGAAPSQIKFNIVVPKGRLWVMGDNRQVSDDSRLRMSDPGGGTIPENMVIGRAFVIVWPPSHWRILPIPSTFNQPGISGGHAAAASQAAAGRSAAARAARSAAAQILGARVAPEPPYVPLSAGVIGAVPLTWLQWRVRRRVRDKLRRGRQHRHS